VHNLESGLRWENCQIQNSDFWRNLAAAARTEPDIPIGYDRNFRSEFHFPIGNPFGMEISDQISDRILFPIGLSFGFLSNS